MNYSWFSDFNYFNYSNYSINSNYFNNSSFNNYSNYINFLNLNNFLYFPNLLNFDNFLYFINFMYFDNFLYFIAFGGLKPLWLGWRTAVLRNSRRIGSGTGGSSVYFFQLSRIWQDGVLEGLFRICCIDKYLYTDF
jgi:hypothetical protein